MCHRLRSAPAPGTLPTRSGANVRVSCADAPHSDHARPLPQRRRARLCLTLLPLLLVSLIMCRPYFGERQSPRGLPPGAAYQRMAPFVRRLRPRGAAFRRRLTLAFGPAAQTRMVMTTRCRGSSGALRVSSAATAARAPPRPPRRPAAAVLTPPRRAACPPPRWASRAEPGRSRRASGATPSSRGRHTARAKLSVRVGSHMCRPAGPRHVRASR